MADKKPDFSGIIKALQSSGVRYVLIGGPAMIAYGSSHVTADIDVHVASLADLIAMKEAADRPKDRIHLLKLRAPKQTIEGQR